MGSSNVGPNRDRGQRSRSRMVGLFALTAAVIVASCASDDDAAPSTPAATEAVADTTTPATEPPATEPATTEAAPTTGPVGEAFVFEGTTSDPNNSVRTWQGESGSTLLSNSFNFDEGDLVGTGTFLGYIEGHTVKGDWVFNVTSPELGEGVLAVQNWESVGSETDGSGTGDVIGLSGGFTDLVGSILHTLDGGSGTYVIELQRMEPAPTAAEPTETMTIDFVSTSTADIAWRVSDYIVGGGATLTGDIVGSASFRSNDSTDALELSLLGAGTLVDEGDGIFIIIFRSPHATPDNASTAFEAEFFGVSGAFAGLRGVGTAVSTNNDATGAFAPVVTYNFELSR